jgi:ribosomal protein S18 acetylase RimI-like enzyme
MKEYTLSKTGGTARVNILGADDIADVLALQDATRAALPAGMKMFVLPQGTAYFQNMLMNQTGMMVGIRTEGKLIAQMVLMGPMPLREAIALHAITNNDVAFPHAALTDSVVIFKSMAVHPNWRGNDLAKNLVTFALDMPFTRVAAHVFAQVSVGNKRSWDVFARQGFGIVAAAHDPNDGQPRFVFQRPSFGFDLSPEVIVDDVDPSADFAAIVNLTQRDALVGLYEQGSTDKLALMRNREASNLMPTLAMVKA